jgi:non-ribosomal peptide synthase protein (TIGR01720 family)
MAGHEPLQPLLAETGQTYGKQNERAHLLDINARVANGRLTFKWQFAPTHFAAAAIQKLAEQTIADLQQIIDHCLHVEQSRHTPSDFPLAGLQQDDLDDLADLLAGLG